MDLDLGYKYIDKLEVVFNGIWWNQKILFQVLNLC